MPEWWQDKEQLKTYIGKWIDDRWAEREAIEAERAQHGITVAALVAELRAAREVVAAAPVAVTLRTGEAFYRAMNRLEDALAAYRAVVGEA